jgi:hypothetical protein
MLHEFSGGSIQGHAASQPQSCTRDARETGAKPAASQQRLARPLDPSPQRLGVNRL